MTTKKSRIIHSAEFKAETLNCKRSPGELDLSIFDVI